MKRLIAILFLSVAILASGCSIKHPIAKDYDQYLLNNGNQSSLPKTDFESDYTIDEKTKTHRYEFRSATVGYANLWIVEFGKILDKTLKANYVQSAFGKFEESTGGVDNNGNLILFSLQNYEFSGFQAHVTLNIIISNDHNEILNKNYHSDGKSQGAKMFWGGVFGMKNATQQSTKLAIDEILREFIQDVKAIQAET